MSEPQSVEIAVQDGELIFQGKCPAKVKRAIRKRFKTDAKFREEVIQKTQKTTV